MTKKRSKSCTYHLRSSKATKRQNSKPHSASSICRSSSSDNKHDTTSEPQLNNAGPKISLATPSVHSQDAEEQVLGTVDSSAAAHLASPLTCTSGKKTVSLEQKSSNTQQRQLERSTSSSSKCGNSSSSSMYTSSNPDQTQNPRKQRAHSVIPVLPIHSSIAQARPTNGSNNQREDVLNAFCTSALWTSVDHPNCGRLNQMKKQYKLEYSFCPPTDSIFTSTQSLSNNHLSTITTTSSIDSQSPSKMTYPPPPPPFDCCFRLLV